MWEVRLGRFLCSSSDLPLLVVAQAPWQQRRCCAWGSVLVQSSLTVINQTVGQLGDRRAQPHRQRPRMQATVQETRLILEQLTGYNPFHTWEKGENL